MRVALATPADLDDLIWLFAGYLTFYEVPQPAAPVRAFLGERLARGDSAIFLARDEAGLAQGFVQLYPRFSSLSLRPAWLLNDLFVSPEARRQGVAVALMNAARAHAEATGACGLQLETARSNRAAQALYEKLGYVRDEVFHTYWLALPARPSE
ncbi:GNAT family N-acetyltransferase [Pseudomonas oryzae]|uniref:Acetyltransferase (GNAT) family protein n=1 Tax=Pseudomonas oryzae TaxID=1392877 RepID=A0A1H1UC19_9PSED|nr:GNAT family N-acetyltransferase [Pseudomonas oryzae]SDS70017.1 Acetyltransferase (GNAT) family protein [Pseudomonas oryzae]